MYKVTATRSPSMGSYRYPIKLTKVVKKFKNFTALDGSLIYHGKRIDVIFP